MCVTIEQDGPWGPWGLKLKLLLQCAKIMFNSALLNMIEQYEQIISIEFSSSVWSLFINGNIGKLTGIKLSNCYPSSQADFL